MKLLDEDKMLIISRGKHQKTLNLRNLNFTLSDLDSFVHGEYDFFCDEDPSLAAVVPDVDVLYTPSHVRLRDFVSFS